MTSQAPAFLEIIDPKTASVRGVNLSKDIVHDVYHYIVSLSKPVYARKNKLFHPAKQHSELEKYEEEAIHQTLIELRLDKLLVQLISLEYECKRKEIVPRLYFAAYPANKEHDIYQIYYETVQASLEAVVQFLYEKEALTREEFWHDLNLDLEERIGTDRSVVYGKIERLCKSAASEWFLPDHQVDKFRRDLEDELMERELGIQIDEYGFAILPLRFIVDYFGYLEGFMNSRLAGLRKKNHELNRTFELIHMEKQYHELTNPGEHTTQFVVSRAEAIKKTRRDQDASVPLAIEYLLALAPRAQERLDALNLRTTEQQYFDVKNRIKDKTRAGEDLIYFIPMEKRVLQEKNIERLQSDRELVHIEWYTKERGLLAFIYADADIYRILAQDMADIPPEHAWQVPVMRRLLLRAEENEQDADIFRDKEFKDTYGSALRKAYVTYMPWYVRPFMKIRIKFLENIAFQVAKREIDQEQNSLKADFYKRSGDIKKTETLEKKKMKERVESMKMRNQLIDILDFFYFQQKMIPTASNVFIQAGKPPQDEFLKVLREHNFQMVSFDSHRLWEDKILLYPVNQSWRTVGRKLIGQLEELIGKSINPDTPDDVQEQVRLAQKLKNYIDKKI